MSNEEQQELVRTVRELKAEVRELRKNRPIREGLASQDLGGKPAESFDLMRPKAESAIQKKLQEALEQLKQQRKQTNDMYKELEKDL